MSFQTCSTLKTKGGMFEACSHTSFSYEKHGFQEQIRTTKVYQALFQVFWGHMMFLCEEQTQVSIKTSKRVWNGIFIFVRTIPLGFQYFISYKPPNMITGHPSYNSKGIYIISCKKAQKLILLICLKFYFLSYLIMFFLFIYLFV